MINYTYFDDAAVSGTSALAPRAVSFTVYEGGKNRAAAQPVARRSEEPRRGLGVLSVIVAVVFGVALACTMAAVGSAAASAKAQRLSEVPTSSVRVETGETLWDVANAHPVDGCSTSEVVDWIRSENSLPTSTLQAGQALIVPSAD